MTAKPSKPATETHTCPGGRCQGRSRRDCFLKTLWDVDATDTGTARTLHSKACRCFTELHGKNHNKKAPFREIRVQKRRQRQLKKHSLSFNWFFSVCSVAKFLIRY